MPDLMRVQPQREFNSRAGLGRFVFLGRARLFIGVTALFPDIERVMNVIS